MTHLLRKVKKVDLAWSLFAFIFLLVSYFFLYKILMPRILAFGCFDDCFNFMGGYFLLKGKHLYSEVFYNHQPFAALLSFFVQIVRHPQNIYDLVRVHRQFLFVFSFLMNFLLLVRFRWNAVGFILFYEFTKFYLFGDRFLAESFIVYPLIYLTGIVLDKVSHKKVSLFDYVIGSIFAWFVIFMREPYILLAIFLYLVILFGKPFIKEKKISLGVFILLLCITLMQFSLKDYFFNVITLNQMTVLHSETAGIFSNPINILKIILYPLFIFFTGPWNFFRTLLIGLDIVFLLSIILYTFHKTSSKLVIILLLVIMAFSNVRATDPGVIFYEGFHMLVWYSIFLFSIFFFLTSLFKTRQQLSLLLYGVALGMFCYFIFSGKSYLADRTDLQTDLITNYGKELQVGEVVRKLSTPSDTLFLDGFDDLIYWQADRVSPYKYSWYTSFMHSIPLYSEAKQRMFVKSPPDFYYGSCIKNVFYWDMPETSKSQYIRLYNGDKPSCLYVNKQKLPEISNDQWIKAEEFGYMLHKNISINQTNSNH